MLNDTDWDFNEKLELYNNFDELQVSPLVLSLSDIKTVVEYVGINAYDKFNLNISPDSNSVITDNQNDVSFDNSNSKEDIFDSGSVVNSTV